MKVGDSLFVIKGTPCIYRLKLKPSFMFTTWNTKDDINMITVIKIDTKGAIYLKWSEYNGGRTQTEYFYDPKSFVSPNSGMHLMCRLVLE